VLLRHRSLFLVVALLFCGIAGSRAAQLVAGPVGSAAQVVDFGRVLSGAEAARRDVRLVHLLAHLQTHDVLTEAQRQKYHELRWGQVTAR
jgi:hypothetical protein